MRRRLIRTRQLAAWACLLAWMFMIVGPLHHSTGHKNDHIHVAGAIVPVSGESEHTHADQDTAPADLIADARGAWLPGEMPDDDRPSERDDDDAPHGFDTLAHFGAAALHTPPVFIAIVLAAPTGADSPTPDTLLPTTRSRGSVAIRGPPASSA